MRIEISKENMSIVFDALMNLPYRYVGELIRDLEDQVKRQSTGTPVSSIEEQPREKVVL
jgi:hypothetical protein